MDTVKSNEHSVTAKPKLGFIGMGRMGSGMSKRFLSAGYHVTVYDRTKEKAESIRQAGADIAPMPKELAAGCDFVLSCVTDDAALEQVMYGKDGALAGLRKGSTIIDLSTVSHGASQRLYHSAKEQGSVMIDAPVSGSIPQVEQGSLVIFVGGDEETYKGCRPILNVIGKTSIYMGPSGMGTTMKLVVNTLLGVGMAALAEAISLGEKAGMSKDLLLNTLEQTSVLTMAQKAKLANVRSGNYPTQFALSLISKDLALVLDLASKVNVPMPASSAARQTYDAAKAEYGNEDFSAVVESALRLSRVPDTK